MTAQPDWECIANLGDVNPIDHGGKFVLVDKTGVYPPELEIVEPCVGDKWGVWRLILEPHTFIDGVLSDNPYHPDKPAWYADDLPSLCRSVDVEPDELVRLLCSADPLERAEGYISLLWYYGAFEFDSCPLELTREEVERRYARDPYNVEA